MDLLDNTVNEKIEKKNNRKRERELSDIRALLLKPEGRRFYWRVMESGKVFNDVFCGDSVNYTNYSLGKQAVSRLFLNDLMDAKPEALQQMQQEHDAEEQGEYRQEQEEIKKSGGLI